MFYRFHQNNSGGEFEGPAENVIIEATSADGANALAENLGMYFDGVDDEIDCECCGDRWWKVQEGYDSGENWEALMKPYNLEECEQVDVALPGVLVRYLDGTVKYYKHI